ncbi:hypothetical protein DFH06DRAFT_1327257 [Mycena polygramma]|nr:hypothetical protein DFH06DRAFT_1327257 [Mycena polygramma]
MDVALPSALPLDLERLIFEITALLWPRTIPRLLLVAWRVKIWVEPVLYRTILLMDPWYYNSYPDSISPFAMAGSVLVSLLQRKPASFFRHSVRQLFLGYNDMDATGVAELLSVCSNVENLYLSTRTLATLPPLNMRLKRLHCRLGTLFDPQRVDSTHRMFASLTHLEIFDYWSAEIEAGVLLGLACLPHLTHLAFNDEEYLPICPTLLRASTSLRVLAIILPDPVADIGRYPYQFEQWGEQCGDRVVVLICEDFCEDWILGVQSGTDYWSYAEEHIAKRKLREATRM